MTKPALKWVGGKTQILEEVLARFPREMETYYEPFLGGGSVLLGLLSEIKAGRIRVKGVLRASDVNSNLIGFYKNLRDAPDALIAEVKKLLHVYVPLEGTVVNRKASTIQEAVTSKESFYFWIRTRFNALTKEGRATPVGSAMFLFLNKTCFRGVYREGPHGFNVPFGNYKNAAILEEAHLREISALLQSVELSCAGFQNALNTVSTGDFVYLDPPYAPETDTSFVGYTADGFGKDDHTALFKMCKEIGAKGGKFLMSNADVKLVRDAFPAGPYTTDVISCRRAIHSKKPDARTNEVLVWN